MGARKIFTAQQIKARNLARATKRRTKDVALLADSYIGELLRKGEKGLKGDIPQELIELKRAAMLLKRARRAKKEKDLEAWMRDNYLTQL